jgi:hypothetical protein
MQTLAAEEADLSARRASHENNWKAMWNPTGVTPGAPADMANWLNAVAALIGDRDSLETDAAKLDGLAMRETALRPGVDALGCELGIRAQGLPLALAMREIESAIAVVAAT